MLTFEFLFHFAASRSCALNTESWIPVSRVRAVPKSPTKMTVFPALTSTLKGAGLPICRYWPDDEAVKAKESGVLLMAWARPAAIVAREAPAGALNE